MIYTLLTTRPATININMSLTISVIFVANDKTNKIVLYQILSQVTQSLTNSLNLKITRHKTPFFIN